MKRKVQKHIFALLAMAMVCAMFGRFDPALVAYAEEPPAGNAIVWDFEDGTLGDFKILSGSFGTLISDIPYDHNSNPIAPYPRQGDWHLTTLESTTTYTEAINPGGKYPVDSLSKMTTPTDAYKGAVRSPVFRLDEPEINFLVGGGHNENVYVALCDAYGQEIITANNPISGETMTRIEWDLSDYDVVGKNVFVKIVDNATSNWGHITFDDFHAVGYVDVNVDILPMPAPEIRWSFEDGALAPFTITEGAFSDDLIASWHVDRNDRTTPVNKDGNYYLSTVEKDGILVGNYNETFTGTICSPKFKIQNPVITMKLAGGTNAKNYVAVCKASDDTELKRVTVPKDGNILADVTIDLGTAYTKDEVVYIKIVDGTTSSYGYIQVDDIRARGVVIKEITQNYSDIAWSFEDGTLSPFTTTDTFGKLVVDRATDRNDKITPMNKDGTYYLSTVEVENPNSYDEGFRGSITSPNFVLDPANPVVKFRISGGTNSANYVALCDTDTNQELIKLSPPKNGHPLSLVQLSLVGKYAEGQSVYIKIVDGTTSGWGFIQVDDFRFKGATPSYTYNKVRWSFENGTILPFTTTDTFGQLIVSRDKDLNNNTTPMGKHGKYYLSTVMTSETAFSESFTGTLRSPSFCLDPNDPKIYLKISGGPVGYVAAYKSGTDTQLAKVNPTEGGHPFKEEVLDLTDKISEGELIYLAIVDPADKGPWGLVQVDDIRASVAFKEEQPLTSESQLAALTGWAPTRFTKLKTMLQDLLDTYGEEEYPVGSEYLKNVSAMQTKHLNMVKKGIKPSDPAIEEFKTEMNQLEYDATVSNPLLTQAPIVFVTRNQYQQDHHNTHNMLPSYPLEINSSSYLGGGAIKVIDFADNGKVSTLKEDADGVYRDPDVSYDGDKILVSYRDNWDGSYNIHEYALSGDKTSIVDEKQLTSMSTADDMDPMYLPSGQIVFDGTRDPKYVMCNRHISSNLYRMEADGANIVKITNSTLFERPTDVLPDGRILYDRWEYNDRDFGSAQGLWTVETDGTQQVTYYGNNSPTGATIDAKAIPGTNKVIATLSSTHDVAWGALAIIDRTKGVDGSAPVERTWPASAKSMIGDPNKNGNNIDAFTGLSIKYEDPQPLSDKYFIASRQIPGKGRKMGLYLLDVFGNETLIYEDASGLGAFDANVLAPREKEIVTAERRNYNDDVGSFFVQNVYQGTHMQGVEPGSVKSLRIVESMDKKYISQDQQWGGEGQQNPGVNWHSFEVKRVLGEVPVYEDGSAYFEVPQDVFVYFQLLDEDGRMIQSMRSGTLVQSGEKTGCVGCHEDRRVSPNVNTSSKTPMALEANAKIVPNPAYTEGSDLPKTIVVNTPDKPQKRAVDFEARTDSLADYDNEVLYPEVTDLPSMNFITEVQPIFTKNCLSCHGYSNPSGGLTLVPDKDVIFNASYMDLWRNRGKSGVYFGNLAGAIGGGSSAFTNAKAWGSYNSPLVKKIYEDEQHKTRLTDAEKRRIAEWVDLNAPYYGDYSTNYGYNPGGRSAITQAERNALGDTRGLSWGSNPRGMIYFDNPEKSPILAGKTGVAYDSALAIIKAGQARLLQAPDVDWRGLTTVPGNSNVTITNPWRFNALDQWRTDKVALRHAIEAANREAIANGTKRYDTDNTTANGLPEWPEWPIEGQNPRWPSASQPDMLP